MRRWRCEYCGSWNEDCYSSCGHCGASMPRNPEWMEPPDPPRPADPWPWPVQPIPWTPHIPTTGDPLPEYPIWTVCTSCETNSSVWP